jgi:hypothetical protein
MRCAIEELNQMWFPMRSDGMLVICSLSASVLF